MEQFQPDTIPNDTIDSYGLKGYWTQVAQVRVHCLRVHWAMTDIYVVNMSQINNTLPMRIIQITES